MKNWKWLKKRNHRRFFVWKYLILILFGVWGGFTALQPGVTGLKSEGDLFDSFSVNRIELDHIELISRLPPSWCFQTLSNTTDGRYIFARCGFNDGHKNFVRDMVWEGTFSGLETIYKPGSQTPYYPGEGGF